MSFVQYILTIAGKDFNNFSAAYLAIAIRIVFIIQNLPFRSDLIVI